MRAFRASKKFWIAVGFVCLSATVSSSAAPTTEGRIHGHVVDNSGAVIANANVYVRNREDVAEEMKLRAHTDVQGDFELELSEGGYDVVVTSQIFTVGAQSVPVTAGKTLSIEFKLGNLRCDMPDVNCDSFPVAKKHKSKAK